MRLPALDKRLTAAYEMIGRCPSHADIGADHGLLPLRLLADDRVSRCVVADISEKALNGAKAAFILHGYSARADFIVADGLCALTKPVDCISILGMGGETLSAILDKGRDRLFGAALVISPHTALAKLRQTVEKIGYAICEERLVYERGRFYVLLRARPGEMALSPGEQFLGPCLLRDNPPLFMEYLRWRLKVAHIAGSEEKMYVEEALKCL